MDRLTSSHVQVGWRMITLQFPGTTDTTCLHSLAVQIDTATLEEQLAASTIVNKCLLPGYTIHDRLLTIWQSAGVNVHPSQTHFS